MSTDFLKSSSNLLYDSFTDDELLVLLKNEDAAAFTVIYHRYFDILYYHACEKLKDKDEAQDILHELFAQLWKNRLSLTITSKLSSYLYTAVKNRVLDFISHEQVKERYIDSLQLYINNGNCVTDYRIREKQLKLMIEEGISCLPEKMQEVFKLSRYEHLSNKEIATKLNISEETVKKQVKNALKILRTKLGLIVFVNLFLIFY
ncbi:RNA polymerase sigma-70 factor [Pedobacter sp. MW01-1-1]|uniref:RNA polymerase sigma-70 factor n=1 Tax=Pedobacter sp. MW01-1-1 TaxID=3383027 RepID=UPI003FF0BACA